jgi:hypothetical protein
VVDSQDRPHIVHINGSTSQLLYSTRGPTGWHHVAIGGMESAGSLAIDADDRLYLVYIDADLNLIYRH